MIRVIFPDGEEGSFNEGTVLLEILKGRDPGLVKKAVAVKVNGEIRDLRSSIAASTVPLKILPVSADTKEGLDIVRHSAAHIMAEAVSALFPEAKFAIGPTIDDGFYYDFDTAKPFTPEDLEKIEEKMREIIKANSPFVCKTVTKDEALKLFSDRSEVYKVEIIGALTEPIVKLYTQGSFTDLCRGPHLPSTGGVKAFKLINAAGAYWRGDEKNKMLQRIYGTAFADKDGLKAHLDRLEEAKKRDHRKLGKELDLFSTVDEIGSGLVLWHPNGAVVRNVIEGFWKAEHVKNDYDIIYTPHIARIDLWKTSGHWDFYRENLFSPMDVEGQDYIVKPMNCPFHIQIYKGRLRSYRDLPVRYAELGTVYRYERSGALHGLLRVRGFTQDDAHIFMTPSQLEGEIKGVIEFTIFVLKSFGFNDFDVYLSTRPAKYVGDLANWEKAESALKNALDHVGLKYEIDPGEGVFYGPKIDIKIKDVIGRAWQCSTIQVDFNLPERFDITYRDETGADVRPIMIHRALMGSLERFFGCLIEHYAGAFPVWLSPVQVIVLTVTGRCDEYAAVVIKALKAAGLRAEANIRNEKLGFKIREAQMRKIPYQLVIGDNEVTDATVALRKRTGENTPPMPVDEFIKIAQSENKPC